MTNLNKCTITPIQKEQRYNGVLDASKNNRAPSLSSEKIFEAKYKDCYGYSYSIDELKKLAIFDILAYEILTEKQLKDIQKNIDSLTSLSFKEIDSRRENAIMKNKTHIEPEYKVVNYYFLRNNKLNIIYNYNNETDAFIMKLENNSISNGIVEYENKITAFKEKNPPNMATPKEWIVRIMLLKQILELEEKKR